MLQFGHKSDQCCLGHGIHIWNDQLLLKPLQMRLEMIFHLKSWQIERRCLLIEKIGLRNAIEHTVVIKRIVITGIHGWFVIIVVTRTNGSNFVIVGRLGGYLQLFLQFFLLSLLVEKVDFLLLELELELLLLVELIENKKVIRLLELLGVAAQCVRGVERGRYGARVSVAVQTARFVGAHGIVHL